jgi:carbonic anhydrase/acetyltransferase-like protein (isoleucine patch superfamily)
MPLIKPYRNVWPRLAPAAFVAENATVIGDVEIGDETSIWYGAILRADVGKIRIGKQSNVQDLACIHMTKRLSDAILGDRVTVGHAAIIHGAVVEDLCLIGMGAVLLDNARIGEGSIVGAGALVTGGAKIPPRSLVLGRPGRVIRQLSDADVEELIHSSERYVRLSREHFGPPGPPLDSSPVAAG